MKLYMIAGEASGDLHGSNLVKSLLRKDPEMQIRCWGGDLMGSAGAELVKHYRDLAFMGFLEVVMNLKTIRSNFKFCKKDIEDYSPDALILIDYPGFNLRMAEWAHKRNIRVYYYISPQLWAWHKSRIKKIKKYVDRMFVILPFEKEFYKKHQVEVDFVGHPLLDSIEESDLNQTKDAFLKEYNLGAKKIVAILPGSRKQEISKMLPKMIQTAKSFPDFQFVIAGAPSVPPEFYSSFEDIEQIQIVYNNTYPLLNASYAAMVTSGTATLETALFKVPEVVCYSGNFVSYVLAKLLIDIAYISLVNLIMDQMIVKELIQNDFNEASLKGEMEKILNDESYRENMLKSMTNLSVKLGGQGASDKTASLMIQHMAS